MFGFQISEIFRKKTEFSNSRNFREKVRKKFGNLSSEKSSVIIQKFRKFQKFQKNDVKFEVLPCFSVKKFEKVQKSLEKVRKSSVISEKSSVI